MSIHVVDGAIHQVAGKELLNECRTLGGCDTGKAKMTGGYRLPAKHVLHGVGPIGENAVLLSSVYKSALDLCLEVCRALRFAHSSETRIAHPYSTI